MLQAKRKRWASSEDLVKSFKFRSGIQSDKISILNAVWDKEMGHFSALWSLVAVKNGVLFVRPKSAAAAQELYMRRMVIMKNLNKYFSRAWIKAIKSSY